MILNSSIDLVFLMVFMGITMKIKNATKKYSHKSYIEFLHQGVIFIKYYLILILIKIRNKNK